MIDFLVIGGGIAGLSGAAHLSALGQVMVLEREAALGMHSSGRSAALYEPGYGGAGVTALTDASGEYFHETQGGYLTPRGALMVATTDQRAGFEADLSDLRLDPIPVAEACDRVAILDPGAVAYAAWRADVWDIDTNRLMQDYARTLRQAGGQIVTQAPVTAITRDSAGWVVQTPGDTYHARQIVNAAGAWADAVAAMAGLRPIGLTPHRRSMARLPAPGGHDVRDWPVLMGPEDSWYAKPDAGKWLVSPSEEDPIAPCDAWADDMVLAEGLARYEAMVTTQVTRVETNWAGLRSFVADREPVLGPDPHQSDFIWCAGQGGYGFQSAPAAARLLADLVSGAPTDLPAASVRVLSAERFL